MPPWREQLEADGFALLPGVLSPGEVSAALAEWEAVCAANAADPAILSNDGPAYGARNLLQLWPRVTELARHPRLAGPLTQVLGSAAGAVRVLFFDKPPGHSWALPRHKDYSIAVAEHRGEPFAQRGCKADGSLHSEAAEQTTRGASVETRRERSERFTKPTRKAGVPHVMAPPEVLHAMLTARIHMDDVTADNGPLQVVPGSHRFYDMGRGDEREQVVIRCQAGDVLLMRPLLTHSSGHSNPVAGLHRRIVHVECAASPELPDGYAWHTFEPLAPSAKPQAASTDAEAACGFAAPTEGTTPC